MCKFKDVPGRTWKFRLLFTLFILMIPVLMLISLSMLAYKGWGALLGFAVSFLLLIPALQLYPEVDC